jgi:outer membrane murein-binding lipoprotein Lpp
MDNCTTGNGNTWATTGYLQASKVAEPSSETQTLIGALKQLERIVNNLELRVNDAQETADRIAPSADPLPGAALAKGEAGVLGAIWGKIDMLDVLIDQLTIHQTRLRQYIG